MLLSVPHSGTEYPGWLVQLASHGEASLQNLEDPLVDRLVWRALQHGVGAVIARAPRAAVDCNRSEDEVDPALIGGTHGGRLTSRARGGLGIVPSRTQQHGHLWRQPIDANQLEQRLEQAHRPYHAALEAQLSSLVDRFGCALLLDCHSMPPTPIGVPPIVFGDCRGRSAHNWVGKEAMAIAAAKGFEAGLNEPFAGGHVVARHGAPAEGVHALQVEIDRRCYLDPTLRQAGPGFDRTASLIDALVVGLGESLIGRQFATAAE